ncbi:MAG: hypothetical protein IPL82_04825 [Elusimicrobia bacterium]|nr:hypothetical protein [Elusimicrobiota bacterium]
MNVWGRPVPGDVDERPQPLDPFPRVRFGRPNGPVQSPQRRIVNAFLLGGQRGQGRARAPRGHRSLSGRAARGIDVAAVQRGVVDSFHRGEGPLRGQSRVQRTRDAVFFKKEIGGGAARRRVHGFGKSADIERGERSLKADQVGASADRGLQGFSQAALSGLIAVDIQQMNDDTPGTAHSGVAFGHSAQAPKRPIKGGLVHAVGDNVIGVGGFLAVASGSGHTLPRHGHGQHEGNERFYRTHPRKALTQKHTDIGCNTLANHQ